MKTNISAKYLIVILLFIAGSISVWGQNVIKGQNVITFDISKGSVTFSDTEYSGKDSNGAPVTGDHHLENEYIITGTTTEHFIRVGDAGIQNFVSSNFIIYLDGVDIRRSSTKTKDKDVCACAVYNKGTSVVAIILKDDTDNILYSGYNRAGLEKSGGASADGTLLITCEEGFKQWLKKDTLGHTTGEFNVSACGNKCGSLDARSGNAWEAVSANTYYHAGAGIGTSGEGSGGGAKQQDRKGTNALVNLTIAGGHITAAGTWGTTGGSSGGAASIGTGCAVGSDKIAGTVSGLKITGGNINAYRMDNSAACIGGGYRSGYVTMDIYGGTIIANDIGLNSSNVTKMRAAAIGGGGGGTGSASPAGATVRIHNGKITASGHYGSAIGSGAGGSTGHGQTAEIIIDNGHITAITSEGDGNGSGAAIGAGGSLGSGYAGNANITINGGKIVATSEKGADIGGGGTNSSNTGDSGGEGRITITGGDITANNGGIGGGRANKGVGGDATITISGENTTITAKSIGGGASKSNAGGDVTLTVEGGKLTVNDYIGGGVGGTKKDQIGCAKVYIKGGEIIGRTVMKASATDGCVFEISGGTLTSPIKDQPGGAVYMIDPDGVATLSGGTINDCQGTTGGAVYMTGGTFTMTNGLIDSCRGTEGGAIYMSGGTFGISGGTISNCKGSQKGGAVYLGGTGTVNVSGGNIEGNRVDEYGGAVYMTGGKFTISGGNMSNNTAAKNGAALYLAGTGEVLVNGGSITGAQDKNVEAIYMAGGSFSMSGGSIADFKGVQCGAVNMEDGTFTMNNGTIKNCNGEVSGAISMSGGTFGISGGTISNCKGAQKGGAVYLGGTGAVNVNGGYIKENSVTKHGGAVYMTGGTFTISGGNISNNAAAQNGGAVYLADGTFNIKGGTVEGNSATSHGGAIYLTDGAFNMAAGKVKANTSHEGNGAGVYIENGKVSLTGGEVTGNEAMTGKGGGFYVAGGDVTLSNGTISSNKAKTAGGGICLEGESSTSKVNMNVTGCRLIENESTEGNGGGVFLSNAVMTYSGGLLTLNKASYNQTAGFTTGYMAEANSVKGIGGGIYISSNSTLTFGDFSSLGVYANTADVAADDLFANGNNTSLILPNVEEMSLENYAGEVDGLGWYEDYIVGDEKYNINNIAKGDSSKDSFIHRFREAQQIGSTYMRLYDFSEDSVPLVNCYVSLALGFLFSDLTIRVEGLTSGESCIFNVQGTAENGKYRYQVPVYGTTAQYDERRIVKLPVDKYTVSLMPSWSWAYDDDYMEPTGGTIEKMNNTDGGVYYFKVQHKATSITHDEKNISIN